MLALLAIVLLLLCAGCRPPQEMADQPSYDPYKPSGFFPDRMSARPQVPGTIPRGGLKEDENFYYGKVNGALTTAFPLPVDEALVTRGRERFNIYCSECHDQTGSGNGMIVRRGYRRPPTFHSDELRAKPVGHYFDVITNGFGAMPPYGGMIPAHDRWAIIAYVRALQLSHHTLLTDVPPSKRAELQKELEKK